MHTFSVFFFFFSLNLFCFVFSLIFQADTSSILFHLVVKNVILHIFLIIMIIIPCSRMFRNVPGCSMSLVLSTAKFREYTPLHVSLFSVFGCPEETLSRVLDILHLLSNACPLICIITWWKINTYKFRSHRSSQSTGHYNNKQNFAFSQRRLRCYGNLAIDSHP